MSNKIIKKGLFDTIADFYALDVPKTEKMSNK